MRNAPPRIPYEKLAFSQPLNVRTKQLDLAQKIGKEEDDYLNDLNQFYLDYHNFEQKRLYFLQLKQLQSIMNQEKIAKSSFISIFLDQLDQRKKNALQILNEPIADNLELEKEVIGLEMKVKKYQKALKHRSSSKYLFGENNINNPSQFTEKLVQPLSSKDISNNTCSNEKQNDKFLSLENQTLELQMQNEEKEIYLRRKNILLNQEMKSINNDLYRIQKTLQLYKTERYSSKHYYFPENDKSICPVNISEINEIILNKRMFYIQEKNKEILQIKEKIDMNKNQNQIEYNELKKVFNGLKEEISIIGKLKKELYQINEEISINKCHLLNKQNEFYDFRRKLAMQNEEIQRINERKSEMQSNIIKLQALLSQKEEENDQERKDLEISRQRSNALENELLTMKKIMEIKQKNLHFVQKQIEAQINGEKIFRKPIKRLLRLEHLGLKKNIAFSSKPLSLKRNENVIANQF